MSSGLRLLFLIWLGTIVFPVIVTVAVGTDMPSLWALQGLFLVAVLIVCGARFPIERFYTVNLMVGVIGFAVVAIVIAAPLHAIYRLAYAPNDRSFYHLAATELTRRWHEVTDAPLSAVSGDDALAFATAFYSEDHPIYRRPFEYQYTWGLPRVSTLSKGWAALCLAGDTDCAHWMEKVTERAPHIVRSEFTVRPSLWGYMGATDEKIVALIVPPVAGEPENQEPAKLQAEEFSASRRVP